MRCTVVANRSGSNVIWRASLGHRAAPSNPARVSLKAFSESRFNCVAENIVLP